MTLPNERLRALDNTKRFLRALLDPKKTPKVPRAIREEAYRCLKHYPSHLFLNGMVDALPEYLKDKYEEYKNES
jgi:hypothetical protein